MHPASIGFTGMQDQAVDEDSITGFRLHRYLVLNSRGDRTVLDLLDSFKREPSFVESGNET